MPLVVNGTPAAALIVCVGVRPKETAAALVAHLQSAQHSSDADGANVHATLISYLAPLATPPARSTACCVVP